MSVRSWILRHKRLVLSTLVIGTLISSYVGWRAWDYTQNDPNFCTSCHLMDSAYDRWQESGHKDVNCHTCHPGDIASNLHQLWVTVTQAPRSVVKHAEVPAKICASCHLSGDPTWEQVADTAGHALHYGQEKIECVECHAPKVHDFKPTDEMCMKCHEGQVVGLAPMEKLHCTSCHDYLGKVEDGLAPNADTCARCHTSKEGDDPVLLDRTWHRDFECATCHPVHDPVRLAAMSNGPTKDGIAVTCTTCHDERVNQQLDPAREAHDACTDCHAPHGDQDVEPRCRACHEPVAEKLPAREHHACADCHRPHVEDFAPEEMCADCHRESGDIVAATTIEEHRQCEQCHAPHEPNKPDASACVDCHKPEHRAARRAPAAEHRACANCHKMHDPSQTTTCGGCHKEERNAARTSPKDHAKCASCHATHGASAITEAGCLSCHDDIAKAERKAPKEHQKCSTCHDVHDVKAPLHSDCGDCHTEQRAALANQPAEHKVCTSCHTWHDNKTPQSTCASCHEGPAGVIKRLSSAVHVTNKEHRECGSCHQPHTEQKAATCSACHKPEAKAVARAKTPEHQACKSCHGDTTHAVRAAKAPITCGDCHKDVKSKALHSHKDHQVCLDCHGEHPVDVLPRAACDRCHEPKDIKNHPAEAKTAKECYGCHVFR
jgi:hypothetical protein